MSDRYRTAVAGGITLHPRSAHLHDHLTAAVSSARRGQTAWLRCNAPGAPVVLQFSLSPKWMRREPGDRVYVEVLTEFAERARPPFPAWVRTAGRLLADHFTNITHPIEETTPDDHHHRRSAGDARRPRRPADRTQPDARGERHDAVAVDRPAPPGAR